jgi:plasmid stability protein
LDFAFILLSRWFKTIINDVKTVPLTIRGCPEEVHRILKQRAAVNRRSLNAEALIWLEKEASYQKPVTGQLLAQRLRKAKKLLTEKEHHEFAADIETARKLMNREHLH